MEQHVLVLFPHPDDETLAVGGAIAYHAKAGSPITYACFTMGQMGRNLGKPFFATRESLPSIREKELRTACEILGIQDLRLMGFRDKTLEFEDPEKLIAIITSLIEELQPSLIITYYPGYCVHPDHEALAEATVAAVTRLPKEKRPRIHAQAFSKDHLENLGDRDVILDTSAFWDVKYRAIQAHKTQTAMRVEQVEKALAGTPEERAAVIKTFSVEALYEYKILD